WCAFAAAVLATLLLPRVGEPRPLRTRALAAALRDPGSALLGVASATVVLAATLGARLATPSTPLPPGPADLSVEARLPLGTSVDRAMRRLDEMARSLRQLDAVRSTWTLFAGERGEVQVRLDGEHATGETLARTLRDARARVGVDATVRALLGTSTVGDDEDGADRIGG